MWRVRMNDDHQAFAELLRRWERPIQRLCARMSGDVHRGQDLAQETFARLFARRKEYEPKGKFSSYLWRVALNVCYDELRRIQRRRELPLGEAGDDSSDVCDAQPAEEPAPDEALAQRERADWVRRALMRLPEAYRSVVILRHYENLRFREIAEVLEIPEGTVKSRMAEALTQLAALLRQPSEPTKENDLCRSQPKRIEETLVP